VVAATTEVESGAIRASSRRRDDALYRGVVCKKHSGGHANLMKIHQLVTLNVGCRTGASIQVSPKIVHRTMHPRRKDSVAGRLHRPVSNVKLGRIQCDDRKEHPDDHYSHSWWSAALEQIFAVQCMSALSLDDHAKVKPDIPDNTSKFATFSVCTNKKSAIDHSTGQPGAFLIIDSIVRLLEDTAPNRARLAGTAPALKSRITGDEKLVSRSGGKPYAIIQLEPWNPSTATQKVNNVCQLLEAHSELDACCMAFLTDKGADHNPTHFEPMLMEAILFFERRL
jgi:hypothetical protein